MRRRKLLIGLMSAGAFTAGFGAAVFPASAQLRTITVTLLGGQTVTVQVDTPPDATDTTSSDALPGASTPVASVTTDAAPPATPTDTGTGTQTQAPAPASTDTGSTPPP